MLTTVFQEAVWATSVSAGQGYTPEPSDLEHLMEIDAKIRLLLPAEELHSLQSSNTDLSVFQVNYPKYSELCKSIHIPLTFVMLELKTIMCLFGGLYVFVFNVMNQSKTKLEFLWGISPALKM